MTEELPLFLGLNDKSITDIPEDRREAALHDQRRAQGRQSRQMGRAAAHADPDRRTRRDRMPGQDPLHRRLCQASGRPKLPSGLRPGKQELVAQGALPASLQPRRRCLDRIENLHLRRLRRAEPLPAFQMLRLRHGDRPMGVDCADLAPARRDVGDRARRQNPSARRPRRALGRMARGLRSGRPTNIRTAPACAARPARSLSSASATTWASPSSTAKSTPSPAAWTPTTSTPA